MSTMRVKRSRKNVFGSPQLGRYVKAHTNSVPPCRNPWLTRKALFTYWLQCVCNVVYACVYMFTSTHELVGQCTGYPLHHFCLRQSLSWNLDGAYELSVFVFCQAGSKPTAPAVTAHHLNKVTGHQGTTFVCSVGAWDPHSGMHGCIASASVTEPSL